MLDRSDLTAADRAGTKPDDGEFEDEWADYAPDPIIISEARRQELR
ncbi:hypothetical protein [Candidatus Poriferisocius sp.]